MKSKYRILSYLYSRYLNYYKSWRTEKKIIVIESDDWGSIRTSDKASYKILERKGYEMFKSPYSLDSLESNDDVIII